MRKVRLKYGMEGYGVYWYCLELIAQNVEQHNLTFELEHDAEIIAADTNIHPDRINEMMSFMIGLGLFEESNGVITCLKLASRTDEYTQKVLRTISQVPTVSGLTPDKVPLNRIEKNRIEKNIKPLSGKPDVTEPMSDVRKGLALHKKKFEANLKLKETAKEMLEILNEKSGRNFKPVDANIKPIICRLKEFSRKEVVQVIVNRCREWATDPKMEMYMRPKTLFSATNFANYAGGLGVK
jgi:uncharacterized phage protein (TIGR02220 family)